MSKYLFIYQGGGGMAATPAEQEAAIAEWTAWFGKIGADLVDMGNPTAQGKTLSGDVSVEDTNDGVSGYSLVNRAASLEAAVAAAKGCPVLNEGGKVQVLETIDM